MDILEAHEPGLNLSTLIERASTGQPFVLVVDGKPVARVTPLGAPEQSPEPRRPGALKGMFNIPDDFDTMFQAEIEEMFYGE